MEEGLIYMHFLRYTIERPEKTWYRTHSSKRGVILSEGGKIDVMKAFLYHVLNDLIVDEYRKRKTTSLEVLLEKGFDPISSDSGRLFNVLDGKTALLLIERLPKTYRKVMRMRYVQDLSLKEMSLITGKSKNSIAVQAHRGLEKLKLLYN
jgi:RNA polymerase sigma-70 factor (ECF subfamily)